MVEQTPATPAPAAAPGSSEPKPATPPAGSTPGAPQGSGDQPEEGKVTISAKEYRELQRQKARLQSFQKRNALKGGQPKASEGNEPGGDASEEVLTELNNLREKTAKDELKILRFEVKEGVANIFSKPEYSKLPKSVKDLIMKNPSALSDADNVEEALIDIEDFVIDQVSELPTEPAQPQNGPGGTPQAANPPGHETPKPAGTGAPAPGVSDDEDISSLTGAARSRAILRNVVRKKARGEV